MLIDDKASEQNLKCGRGVNDKGFQTVRQKIINLKKLRKIPLFRKSSQGGCPFFIEGIENWTSLLVTLRCSIPTIAVEMKSKFIKINVDSEIEYRQLQWTLQQEGIYYKSFLLEKEKHHMLSGDSLQIRLLIKLKIGLTLMSSKSCQFNDCSRATLGIKFRWLFSLSNCPDCQILPRFLGFGNP